VHRAFGTPFDSESTDRSGDSPHVATLKVRATIFVIRKTSLLRGKRSIQNPFNSFREFSIVIVFEARLIRSVFPVSNNTNPRLFPHGEFDLCP
jgi:hypothetical protein